MNNSVTRGFGTVSILGLLAACGGSSTGGGISISQAEADRQLFAADLGALSEALDAGETVTARSVASSALIRNYATQSSELADDVLVQVKKNADGELSLIVDGTEVAFATGDRRIEEDGDVFGYEQDGDNFYYNLFSWDGDLDELLTGNDSSARPVAYYFETPGSDTALLGYAIIGTETGAGDLPSTGTAELDGYAVIGLFPEENLANFASARERLRADVEITADFANDTLSGEMTNLVLQSTPNDGDVRTDIAGVITMEETSLNANGFEGRLTMDAAGLADASNITDANVGTYGGTFYGEDAEQAAGTISTRFENDNGVFNGYGFFTTD